MTQKLPDAAESLEPDAGNDPLGGFSLGLDERCPAHAALTGAAPVVRAEAPAGGPVFFVTDHAAARKLLVDPRVRKDPALAPAHWNRWSAGLEPTADEQASLTTLDGAEHTALRTAHASLMPARRMAEFEPRVRRIAKDLLAEAASHDVVDLMDGFSTRYPLTVLCDVLGVPLDRVGLAATACQGMRSYNPADVGRAMATFAELAASALADGRTGLASELRDRLPAGTTPEDLEYFIFTLLFAGQLTTDPAVGFLVARLLDGGSGPAERPADALVRDVLRQHPPAPFSLWRFTTEEIDLGGVTIPARSPVLVDIEGINASTADPATDLTFGAGPHYCTGAHLAQLELRVLAEVLRADYPSARLDVPFATLRHTRSRGINGSRLTALPVRLRG